MVIMLLGALVVKLQALVLGVRRPEEMLAALRTYLMQSKDKIHPCGTKIIVSAGCDVSSFPRPSLSSPLILSLLVWLTFFLSSSFDCNLRANLMVVGLERFPETQADVLDMGRRFYMVNSVFMQTKFRKSPLDTQRALAKRVL